MTSPLHVVGAAIVRGGRLLLVSKHAALAWVGAFAAPTLTIAPAVREHLIPALVEAGLLT